MPWKPIAPIDVFCQRIIIGRIALPFHAVDCGDLLYTLCTPGCSLLYLLPDTSQERRIVPSLSTAHTRWPVRL